MKTKNDTRTIANETARYFAENLIRLRSGRRMPVKVAAAELGVAESTWYQWESGKRFPPCNLLNLIARLFDVKPCLLLAVAPEECAKPGHCGGDRANCPALTSQNVEIKNSSEGATKAILTSKKQRLSLSKQRRKGRTP